MNNSNTYFKESIDNSIDGITIATGDGHIIYVNRAMCQLVNRSAEEILHHGRNILFRPGDEKLAQGLKMRDEHGVARGEFELVDSDGNVVPVDISSSSYIDEDGNRYFTTIFRDIRERKALENEILENKERYQVLSDSAFEGIAISVAGVIAEVNKALADYFGYTRDEMIGMHAEDLVTDECKATVINNIKIKYLQPYQVKAIKKDGSTFILEVCGKNIFYKGKEARITSFRDITDKINAASEIKSYEQKFQALVEYGSDMIGLLNETGEYVYISPSVERILGYRPEQLTGRHPAEFIHPEDKDNTLAYLADTFMQKVVTVPDFRFKHANGSYVWIEARLDNMLDVKGVNGIFVTSRDITQRKLAELALKQREEHLAIALENIQRIFDYSMDMICTIDANGKFVDVSQSSYNILGIAANHLWGKAYMDFVYEEDREKTIAMAAQIMSGQPVVNFENRYVDVNGNLVDIMWSANWSNESQIMFCVARDITEVKRAARKLKISEQKFRSLFENHPDSVFEINMKGEIIAANDTFLKNSQMKIEEIRNKSMLQLFNFAVDEISQQNIAQAFNGQATTFDTGLVHYKGRDIKSRVTIIPVMVDEAVTGAYLISKRITEQWRNEQRLLANKQMLEGAAYNAQLQNVVTEYLKHIESIYPNVMCSIQLIERGNLLYHFAAPSLPDSYKKMFNGYSIKSNGNSEGQVNFVGAPFVSTDVNDDVEDKALLEILYEAGVEAFISYPVIAANGKPLAIISFNYKDKTTLHDDDVYILGEIVRLITLVFDNRQSLEKIKTKNQELQKINSELDRFSYSTSHELRAPLSTIRGLVNLASTYGECSPDVQNYLRMIERSALKLEKFVLEIGDYYHNKSAVVNVEKVNLHTFVNESIKNLQQEFDTDITFDVQVQPGLTLYTDPQRLNILLTNILINAIKYHDSQKPEQYVSVKAAQQEDVLELLVEDNGTGIAEQCLPKVFDMFYRATETSNGSGLGLYIVREIVNRLNGKLYIDSALGSGTTVKLIMPLHQHNNAGNILQQNTGVLIN